MNKGFMLLLMLAYFLIPIGLWLLYCWWDNAICPRCKKRSPDFVWSWGTGGNKTLCEGCDPDRIKEVFGNNLNYVEHLAKKKNLV